MKEDRESKDKTYVEESAVTDKILDLESRQYAQSRLDRSVNPSTRSAHIQDVVKRSGTYPSRIEIKTASLPPVTTARQPSASFSTFKFIRCILSRSNTFHRFFVDEEGDGEG